MPLTKEDYKKLERAVEKTINDKYYVVLDCMTDDPSAVVGLFDDCAKAREFASKYKIGSWNWMEVHEISMNSGRETKDAVWMYDNRGWRRIEDVEDYVL